MTRIANLAPSRRGIGLKGASQKPLNVKNPKAVPPPKARCRCCAGAARS